MRRRLLDLIACPKCLGTAWALTISSSEGDEIVEGHLVCGDCAASYSVTRGVPRLVPDADLVSEQAQDTVDRFGQQWNEFEHLDERYQRQLLDWISPVSPEDFKDKIVLEGGCGKGRHSVCAAEFGAKDVIAVDLGSGVEAAHRNALPWPNVHVVQADLFHLPVPKNSVDLAFSVGVLHHTQDPRGAFLQLVERLRPGGRIAAWVYGAENNEWITGLVDPVRKAVTSKLPHRMMYHLSKVPAGVLYAAMRGVYRPLSKGPLSAIGDRLFYSDYINYLGEFPFREVHNIVHDHLVPPIAYYIPKDEFEDWFRDGQLEQVTLSWHNQNSWRGTGLKPERAS